MAAIVDGGKLRLTGFVGEYNFEDCFTSEDVVLALASLDDSRTLEVLINSAGGIATEGAAIHALFSSWSAGVNVTVEGIAASAASLIVMAGETVTMAAGALMMIHDPSGFTVGNSADHSKTIEALEALATAYARIYAAKSGKSPAECRQIMKDERWFTPEEAVEEGFADSTIKQRAKLVAAFDYSSFMHAPRELVALARKNKWMASSEPKTTQPASKETKMTKNNQVQVSVKDRIKAIMKSEEAEGRNDLAEHLAYDTDLDPDAAIAIMKAAHTKSDTADEPSDDWRPRRTMNAAGLNRADGGRGEKRESRLVASMKQRHAQK